MMMVCLKCNHEILTEDGTIPALKCYCPCHPAAWYAWNAGIASISQPAASPQIRAPPPHPDLSG